MTQEHPTSLPSRELIDQWRREYFSDTYTGPLDGVDIYVAQQAARWAADQQLEACAEWLRNNLGMTEGSREIIIKNLYADLRPKPKSLKQQALETLERVSKDSYPCNFQEDADWDIIRRALETIPDV